MRTHARYELPDGVCLEEASAAEGITSRSASTESEDMMMNPGGHKEKPPSPMDTKEEELEEEAAKSTT